MKSRWVTAPLGEVAEVAAGNPAPQADSLFKGGSYPFFRTSDAGRVRFGDLKECADFLNAKGTEGLRLFPKGTILLPKSGASTFLNHRVMLAVDGYVSSHLGAVIADPNKILPRYLLYFLATVSAQGLIQDHAYPSLTLGTISSIPVVVPPLSDQQRIAVLLDEAFAALATATASVGRSIERAREVFTARLHAEFSVPPADWVTTTIGEHVKFIDYRGRTPAKTELGIPLITAKNVKMGFLQEEPREYVAPETYDSWMTRGIPKRGDVLFTTEAPLGNVAQLETDDRVVFAQRIIIMQPDPANLDGTFLKYMLLSPPVQQRIREKGTGATATGIKAKLLKQIPISFPSQVAVQRRIAREFDDLDAELDRLASIYDRKLELLQELRAVLLHHAFVGSL